MTDLAVILFGIICLSLWAAQTMWLVLTQGESLGPLEPSYPLSGTGLDDQHDWEKE